MVGQLRYLTLAAVAGVLALAGHVGAASTCQTVRASGETFFNGTAFVGSGVFTIDGEDHAVTSSTVILETVRETKGALHLVTSHHFGFGDGNSLTTRDRVVLAPTSEDGVHRLESVLEIVSGTGIYAEATGKLASCGDSTIDLIQGHAIWECTGRICP